MGIAAVGLGGSGAEAETSQEIVRRHFGASKVNGVAARGERPLAVALLDFADQPMPQNRAYYDWLWFEQGSLANGLRVPDDAKPGNVWRSFIENSYGEFRWRKAGLFGPFRYPDDPLTTADETRSACVLKPEDCPGMGVVAFQTDNRRNYLRVNAPGTGSIIDAAGTNPGGNGEGISLIDLNGLPLVDGDYVNLMSFHGNYVRAEFGGDYRLIGDRTEAGTRERFRLIKRGGSWGSTIRHGDRVAIQNYYGLHVSADNGGGGIAAANRQLIGAWEHFTLLEQPHNNARTLRTAMELSAPALDYAQFDTDRDSLVEEHELAFARVFSTATAWGQHGGYLDRFTPRGAKIDIRPAQVVFDAFAGLGTIVHELAHALKVEHVYGSQWNSEYLTPMSTTVGDPSNEYDRDSYHFDPWTKFRLGWLSPRLVRIDAPLNTCRWIEATDTDDPYFTHGPISGSYSPDLYYHEGRPNEYYMVEHRQRGGYDADVASEGLAVWLVMVDDNGNLIQLPGNRITPGPDGTFQSQLRPDDELVRSSVRGDAIESGSNRWLDSIFDPRDARSVDPVNVSLGAPTSTWGGNALWTSTHGVFRPLRSDRKESTLALQVGEPLGSAIEIESSNASFQPTLSGINPMVAPSRTVFTIRGNLGVRGAKKVEARNVVTGAVYTGSVRSWRCPQAEVQFVMPEGTYDVSVVGDDPKMRSGTQHLVIFPLRLL